MRRFRSNTGFLSALLLLSLMFTAQVGSATHAFQHDPGTAHVLSCAGCLTATQLASASLDSIMPVAVLSTHVFSGNAFDTECVIARLEIVRQRGPPAPFQKKS